LGDIFGFVFYEYYVNWIDFLFWFGRTDLNVLLKNLDPSKSYPFILYNYVTDTSVVCYLLTIVFGALFNLSNIIFLEFFSEYLSTLFYYDTISLVLPLFMAFNESESIWVLDYSLRL
jgi:hypothetical protein